MEEWKEFSAKTADEALTNALIQMETTSDQIEFLLDESKSPPLGNSRIHFYVYYTRFA